MTQFKYIVLALLIAALSSCGQESTTTSTPENNPEKQVESPDHISLTTAQVKTAGIEWGAMESKTGNAGLKVTGELRVHNEYIATVSAWADGTVAELRTGINKPVAKGAVVAVLRQPMLLDWQQDYLETRDRLQYLNAEFNRYKNLKEDNATASKNYEKAASELQEAQTRSSLLAAKLKMYHIDAASLQADKVSGTFELRAPVSGIITRTFITNGSAVQAGTPICEIVDMNQIHADLFVFEKDLNKVKVGQSVRLRSLSSSDNNVYATIFSIDPGVDPERKAIRVHARFRDKPLGTLVNGAYTEGLISLSNGAASTALPADAVVREGDNHFIFILEKQLDNQLNFRKVRVAVSPAQDGYLLVEPSELLPADAKVVKKGAYYVSAQGAEIEVE